TPNHFGRVLIEYRSIIIYQPDIAAALNMNERLNCNIWLVDYDRSVFNENPAKMIWGNRIELVLKETRLR
ncbi:MAG: hypothetical protein AAFY41_04910, partial [Bacteroidota bacterium]